MRISAINPVQNYSNKYYYSHVLPSSAKNQCNDSRGCYTYSAYMPLLTFRGTEFEDNILKQVDSEYWGKGIFNGRNYIDFKKCGSEFLFKNGFDINTASNKEIYAFQYSNALRELKETNWVQRFTPYNTPVPLATFHTLGSQEARRTFRNNLNNLHNTSISPNLDVPITDKKGRISIDCVVFDTETTGTNHSDYSKPLDRIIQIGAVMLKNGKVVKGSELTQLFNPEIHIPEESSAVHGIYDEDVQDMPRIGEFLPGFLKNYMSKENGVIVAYNSKFDIPMIQNAIVDYNLSMEDGEKIKKRNSVKVLDPFILIQRIHPYLGARKKLSEQYTFLFCKNLEGAHDALADVKGTVDVLKYCLYYLDRHRIDKSKPLTIRDVLLFQNGECPENLNMTLNHNGVNAKAKFDMSYRKVPLNVDGYFKGYILTSNKLENLRKDIGENNYLKILRTQMPDYIVQPDSEYRDENILFSPKVRNLPSDKELMHYIDPRNFKKALSFMDIEPYGGKSSSEIIGMITEGSKNYVNDDAVLVWMKNVNPKDVRRGNDLPDYRISKKVMKEANY